MLPVPHCPRCERFVFLDALRCPACDAELGYNIVLGRFFEVDPAGARVDGVAWFSCSNRSWGCNWLVREDAPSGRCFSCRLTRRRPDADDTIALEKLASTEEAKRRMLLQLRDLGLPVRPWDQYEGGLGFDLISSLSSGERVVIGHAGGIITIDLAESLDDRREALRIRLGEPYRTMLGHLRHEIGHYFQSVLLTTEAMWESCRALFGDERASYQDALERHYATGAPPGWQATYISEYATMHPWEDFAETFAHYLHITGTLQTAGMIGIEFEAGERNLRAADVVLLQDYNGVSIGRILDDWAELAQAFNRINRSMGLRDLYPFEIVDRVRLKLGFIHDLVERARIPLAEQVAIGLPPRPAADGGAPR
ncbi:MAG: putative zinc-binding metallopeptidase [Microbacteriaceae bacterium]|nr:putative zinc-binding metallopeptidase [Microbacteriaceae bacterium]